MINCAEVSSLLCFAYSCRNLHAALAALCSEVLVVERSYFTTSKAKPLSDWDSVKGAFWLIGKVSVLWKKITIAYPIFLRMFVARLIILMPFSLVGRTNTNR